MLDRSELPRYLAKIDSLFGIADLLKLPTDNDTVIRYYTESEKGYRLFHSRDGSVHMSLRSNGVSDDNLGQARLVEAQVRELKAESILELGCGKGFNVAYLARKFPNAKLFGIDLTPNHIRIATTKYRNIANLHFEIGDFQSLSFADEEYDVVFEVEAVCHARDAASVFKEVHRTLRPGGRFILFDGFRAPDLASFPADIQTAVRLVEVTMAVRCFPSLDEWLYMAKAAGFKVVASTDLSDAIMPNLERFQVLARGFYKFPALAKRLTRLLPPALVSNSVAGLLMPFTVSTGAQRYYSIVLEKASTKIEF